MFKLDKIDRKILYYLDENCRYTNSYIAKQTNISTSNVIYRINRLIEAKIIDEFYLLLNPFAFKQRYDRFVVKFRSDWNIEKIKDYCRRTKKIGWYILFDGKWNFGCQIWADNIVETKEIVDKFLAEFTDSIEEYTISSLISIEKFEHNFLFEEFKSSTTKMDIVESMKLDNLDIKIINFMFKNARAKILDIANHLNVDYKVISYRLKKLEEKKVILGYKTQFNRFNLGYDYYKIKLDFSLYKLEDKKEIYNYLKSDSRIVFIAKALGWADLEFEIFCKNQNEYREFMDAFKRKFATRIKNFEVLIPLEFDWNHFMP